MAALMRIAKYTHPDVFIEKDDTVIFSSKIIPGNEKKLYNLQNQLVKDGIRDRCLSRGLGDVYKRQFLLC